MEAATRALFSISARLAVTERPLGELGDARQDEGRGGGAVDARGL